MGWGSHAREGKRTAASSVTDLAVDFFSISLTAGSSAWAINVFASYPALVNTSPRTLTEKKKRKEEDEHHYVVVKAEIKRKTKTRCEKKDKNYHMALARQML